MRKVVLKQPTLESVVENTATMGIQPPGPPPPGGFGAPPPPGMGGAPPSMSKAPVASKFSRAPMVSKMKVPAQVFAAKQQRAEVQSIKQLF